MSTSTLAAGCTMSSVFMIVAPSLEMVTDPCAWVAAAVWPHGKARGGGRQLRSCRAALAAAAWPPACGARAARDRAPFSARAHPVVVHQLVHSPRPKRRANHVGDGHAGVDVADQLRLALAGVRTLPQQDDLGLLRPSGARGSAAGPQRPIGMRPRQRCMGAVGVLTIPKGIAIASGAPGWISLPTEMGRCLMGCGPREARWLDTEHWKGGYAERTRPGAPQGVVAHNAAPALPHRGNAEEEAAEERPRTSGQPGTQPTLRFGLERLPG
jgi:hypothetical protein